MRYVSQPVKKLDGMPIIKGKPLYTNDLAPNECLIVLALRSPYAYARITVSYTHLTLPTILLV